MCDMRRLCLLLLVACVSIPAAAQLAAGDLHWENRGAGNDGARANPAEIEAAIAAYQIAIRENTRDLEPRWKLVRALRFKAAYVAPDNAAKRDILADARAASSEAVRMIERSLATKGVKSFDDAQDETIAKAAKAVPEAAAVFYWDAVAWGEWGVAYGKLAAVRQGAAERVRKSSTVAMLIDPDFDGGGGARVLGRLHNQTPRVPFLTGWASDKLAVRYLRESLSRDPSNKLTKVFLAEAMVANDSSTKPQAVDLLREVINSPNAMDMIVENFAAQEDALALLERWGVK
jgi:hypothetical protein